MEKPCPYGFGKTVALDFDRAVDKVERLLQEHGFGIYSRIDLQKNLEKGLGVPFRRYLILGACNAAFAYKAFSADENIGLLLPCNVIVYEDGEGRTTVMAMDPARLMDLVRNPAAIEVAIEVKDRLERVLELV